MLVIALTVLALLCQTIRRASSTVDPFSQQKQADLMYVYMEGCGHCKKFDPTWTAFTKQYKSALKEAGVTVRKLHNGDEAAKGLGLDGFPSVLLISTSGDFPKQIFSGERTVPGLVAFVQTSVPLFSA